MGKIVNSRILLLFVVLSFILVGCTNLALGNNKKDNTIHGKNLSSQTNYQNGNNKVSNDNNSLWKKTVAEKLLSEFNEYYKKMQSGDDTTFNRIMAADRATGLLCVYKDYISSKRLKDINNKAYIINKKIGDSHVSFGYTTSGLHVIALITAGFTSNSINYESVCNKIRNTDQEINLIWDLQAKCNYQASDVFIEDLRNKRKKFDVNIDFVQIDGRSYIPKEEVKNVSDKAKEILKKYNRIMQSKNGNYVNKSWRLIAAPLKSIYIYDFLRIYVDDEKLDLVTNASDAQNQGE